MNRIYFILFVILTLISLDLFSQNSFPENGAIWQTEEITIAGPVPYFYGMCDDTLINNLKYQKMYRLSILADGGIFETYIGATRVEEGKSWFVRSGNVEEVLLYEFALEAGDSITVLDLLDYPVTLHVDSTGIQNIEGNPRKIIYFAPVDDNFFAEYWIEGIGSNRGPVSRGYLPAFDYEPELVCFTDGVTNYTIPETMVECILLSTVEYCNIMNSIDDAPLKKDVQLYPNPSDGNFYISTTGIAFPDGQLNIYNAKGQLIHSQEVQENALSIPIDANSWPKGMYMTQFNSAGKNAFQRKNNHSINNGQINWI